MIPVTPSLQGHCPVVWLQVLPAAPTGWQSHAVRKQRKKERHSEWSHAHTHTHTHTHTCEEIQTYTIYKECRWVHRSSGGNNNSVMRDRWRRAQTDRQTTPQRHILNCVWHPHKKGNCSWHFGIVWKLIFWRCLLICKIVTITSTIIKSCKDTVSADPWHKCVRVCVSSSCGCLAMMCVSTLWERGCVCEVKKKGCACLPNDKIMEDNPNCLFLISAGLWTPAPERLSHFLPNWGVYRTHMLQECNHFQIALPQCKLLIYFTAKPLSGLESALNNSCLRAVSFHLSDMYCSGINSLLHSAYSKSRPEQVLIIHHHFHFFTPKTKHCLSPLYFPPHKCYIFFFLFLMEK